jgi:hypothetical protein
MTDQQAKWQRQFDREFPAGAVATWHGTLFNISYIHVASMAGLDPVLDLYCLEERVLDGLRLTSWEVVRAAPHLIVLATFADHPYPMQLCAAVSAKMAELMPSDRERVRAALHLV